jgi:aryl-alcohol dehydrogenase-like predicted oxidoreductase
VEHCRKRRRDIAKLALQFASSNRDIATTLVGTSNVKKLKQDVRWMEEPMDEGLLAEVRQLLKPILNRSWLGGLEGNP